MDGEPVNVIEDTKVAHFLEKTYGCHLYNNQPCCKAFSKQHIIAVQDQCLCLDHSSLDFLLMGHIMAHTRTAKTVHHPGLQSKEREKQHSYYYHNGVKV